LLPGAAQHDRVPVVVDRLTDEIRNAQIFIAAPSFTFAHASRTRALPDWIDAHVRAHFLVPDNTKTAVIKACLYNPQVNPTYAEMAAHYGIAILPTQHKTRLATDCTSCRSALANQVRLVLHTTAYWLMLTVRDAIPKARELAIAVAHGAMMQERKSGAASAHIVTDTEGNLVGLVVHEAFRTAMAPLASLLRSARAIPGWATSSPMVAMPERNCAPP
jgi:hypothetical protein